MINMTDDQLLEGLQEIARNIIKDFGPPKRLSDCNFKDRHIKGTGMLLDFPNAMDFMRKVVQYEYCQKYQKEIEVLNKLEKVEYFNKFSQYF